MNTTLGIAAVALLLGLLLSAGALVLGALGLLVWARAKRRRMRLTTHYRNIDDDQSTMVPHRGYRPNPPPGDVRRSASSPPAPRSGEGSPRPSTPGPRASRAQAQRRPSAPKRAEDMRRHTPPPQHGRDLGLQTLDPLAEPSNPEPSNPELEGTDLLGYLDDEHTRSLDTARSEIFATGELPLDWAETEDDDELATEIFSAHSAGGDLADLGLDEDSSDRFR